PRPRARRTHGVSTTAAAVRGLQVGPLPLVIGVAGHRHLEPRDYPVYQKRIRELFAYFLSRYPSTPLRIMSSLASGPDRLVAEVALEQGWEVLAPLPMDREEYERDFPQSLEEFRGLLARLPPENVFVVAPPQVAPGATPQELRDGQYREVGICIASQCH